MGRRLTGDRVDQHNQMIKPIEHEEMTDVIRNPTASSNAWVFVFANL